MMKLIKKKIDNDDDYENSDTIQEWQKDENNQKNIKKNKRKKKKQIINIIIIKVLIKIKSHY